MRCVCVYKASSKRKAETCKMFEGLTEALNSWWGKRLTSPIAPRRSLWGYRLWESSPLLGGLFLLQLHLSHLCFCE